MHCGSHFKVVWMGLPVILATQPTTHNTYKIPGNPDHYKLHSTATSQMYHLNTFTMLSL